MAIKAGLVGVNPKGVDKNGMPISSGGANVEAEIQQINLDIAQLQASKVGIGQLTANNKAFNFAYDSTTEKYGYKLDGTGVFIPFESAGGGPGWVKPADATTQGITISNNCTVVDGGFAQDNNNVYIDLTVKMTGKTNLVISGLPLSEDNASGNSRFLPYIKGTSEDIKNVYVGSISNTASLSKDDTHSKITFSSTYLEVDTYIHCICQYKKATTS